MKDKIRKFFGIKENKIVVEWMDISAILTILNVLFIICGFWWAPIIGLINAITSIIILMINKGHINAYIINFALIALNIYFLKG